MAETTYTYNAADFPDSNINPSRMQDEIGASAIITALDRIDTVGGTLVLGVVTSPDSIDIVFKDALSAGDKTLLDGDTSDPAGGLIAAHDNSPSAGEPAYDSDGNMLMNDPNLALDYENQQKVVMMPTPGSEKNFYSPNMCDKCCWYPGSPTATEEELTDSSDHITYDSVNTHWIDVKHGRLFKEDGILAEDPTLGVVVEVQTAGVGDWVEKTENSYGSTDDGDYTVTYETGAVVFNAALGATDKVRASYHYGDTYCFFIEPAEGKQLKVVYSEVQYTADLKFNQHIHFEFEVYNPEDLPNRVVVGGFKFKRLMDFYQESTGPFPVIPHHGGASEVVEAAGLAAINTKLSEGYNVEGTRWDAVGEQWVALMHGIAANGGRAIRHPLLTVPFHYNAFKLLMSSIGLRLKITLETSEPLGGSFGNTTAYCLSEDE